MQPLHTFLEDAPTHNHRDISWGSGTSHRIHFFDFNGEFNVWGLTAGILIAVAQIALGRAPEFAENIPGSRPFTDIWFDGSKVAYRDDL